MDAVIASQSASNQMAFDALPDDLSEVLSACSAIISPRRRLLRGQNK
jgi:hypothetical protein